MNMKYSLEFEKFYLDSFKKEYSEYVKRLEIKMLEENHVILYGEEPNVIGKFFLKNQHKSDYVLEQRVVTANLDGDNMDIEFYEAKLKNGKVGHIEFDFLGFQKNKVYYILDKVIEPVIETSDIGKLLDENEAKSKIVYLKNLDVILPNLSDDKVEKKILSWLEKHVYTTRFLFTFYSYNNNTTNKFVNYCNTIRIPKIRKLDLQDVRYWLKKVFNIEKELSTRTLDSFLGVRYYLRYMIDDEYYDSFYELIDQIHKESNVKNRYLLVRAFLIGWLQSGKNYRELIHEIVNYICKIKNSKLREKMISEVNRRSCGLENSKKIMYHLENVLSIFIE